tara:strand:- start:4243 stop:4725 length:483 start_codon:yes stop_codon:yes gene_type:complete
MNDKITTLYPLKKFKNSSQHNDNLEYLRKTRNSSKQFMTRYQNEITIQEQKLWYDNLSSNITPYIFMVCEMGVIFYPCGYGIILIENNIAMLTGVVDEGNRGEGLGRRLFLNLISEAKKKTNKIHLEVLKANERAINLYKSLGFIETLSKDKIIDMKLEL